MSIPLTPDTTMSDDMADSLASMHESLIAMARSFANIYGTTVSGEHVTMSGRSLDDIIQTHTDALISLGRPRVAPDLRAKGWRFDHNIDRWVRPYTDDEYPFSAELDVTTSLGQVWADNNFHARVIDGTIPMPKWGIPNEAEHYVV